MRSRCSRPYRRHRVAFKVIHAPRVHTRRLGGHSLPTHLLVENLARGTQTEVWIEQISVDPGPPDPGSRALIAAEGFA